MQSTPHLESGSVNTYTLSPSLLQTHTHTHQHTWLDLTKAIYMETFSKAFVVWLLLKASVKKVIIAHAWKKNSRIKDKRTKGETSVAHSLSSYLHTLYRWCMEMQLHKCIVADFWVTSFFQFLTLLSMCESMFIHLQQVRLLLLFAGSIIWSVQGEKKSNINKKVTLAKVWCFSW